MVWPFERPDPVWRDAVEYTQAFRSEVLSHYEATLAAIERHGRQPTPWEAQCLLSALSSIATDSWLLAEDNIKRCRRAPRGRRRAPEVTVQGLRQALADIGHGKDF
jgi:hypothetical protein